MSDSQKFMMGALEDDEDAWDETSSSQVTCIENVRSLNLNTFQAIRPIESVTWYACMVVR